MLAEALFGEHPSAEALIAELDGEPVGFALFHGTFSTWECRAGDLARGPLRPAAHRRGGVGGALLARVAAIAVERGCARLEWNALDWNDPALSFYERLGATRLPEWELHRLAGGERVACAARVAARPRPRHK